MRPFIPFLSIIVQCADLKREDGTTMQTWQCDGGNPQQVRLSAALPNGVDRVADDSPRRLRHLFPDLYHRRPLLIDDRVSLLVSLLV